MQAEGIRKPLSLGEGVRGREWGAPLQDLLSKTAVLKLNGGLGTSMGLEKAKSLLEVRDGKTFLDLIAEQIEHTRHKIGAQVLHPRPHLSPGRSLQDAAPGQHPELSCHGQTDSCQRMRRDCREGGVLHAEDGVVRSGRGRA